MKDAGGTRLLFFPLRDGTFYYYRHGRLLAEESYWRDQGQSRFDPEMELYNRFRAEESPELVRLFLYFGHEIPEFGGAGYDASYKNRTFTVDDLADGLKCITRDSTKVDLVVLSTCFSGTPRTIAALAPYARYVIASPDNLHLSYFDLSPFERLDIGLRGRRCVWVCEYIRSACVRQADRRYTDGGHCRRVRCGSRSGILGLRRQHLRSYFDHIEGETAGIH